MSNRTLSPATPALPLVPVHRARCGCCLVVRCPFCGKQHTPGAAGQRKGLGFRGFRLAHCLKPPTEGASYWLVEVTAAPPFVPAFLLVAD